MRTVVLDDYQQVAGLLADWSTLGAEIVYFSYHISDPAELVSRLTGFDVVVVMRERTLFPAPFSPVCTMSGSWSPPGRVTRGPGGATSEVAEDVCPHPVR
jgi:hypothetical protein